MKMLKNSLSRNVKEGSKKKILDLLLYKDPLVMDSQPILRPSLVVIHPNNRTWVEAEHSWHTGNNTTPNPRKWQNQDGWQEWDPFGWHFISWWYEHKTKVIKLVMFRSCHSYSVHCPLRRFPQSDSSLQRPDMEANPHVDINKKKKIDSENSK